MAEIHLYPQVLSRKCLFKQKTSGKLRGLLHIDHIVPCEIAYMQFDVLATIQSISI